MKTLINSIVIILGLFIGVSSAWSKSVTANDVVDHYGGIAHAVYEDALTAAKALQVTVKKLVSNPSKKNLTAAKMAWKQSRVPYQQSEVFRFGNAIVDDWEGQLNAWPLDEGLIDYVDSSYEHEMGNVGATANIIANKKLTIGSDTLDLTTITPALLADLNELAGSEANVATGYHAIEFLLWGQDLNGTDSGAGARPWTDYASGDACTNGNCQRRGEYLLATTQLLVDDLEEMVSNWAPGQNNYRKQLVAGESTDALRKMLFGMGSLSLGELAGERMKVALEANSPEDEHDCFSDNTHNSHYYNAKGIRNIYLGSYRRIDGSVVQGASLADLVSAKDKALNERLISELAATEKALDVMVESAESGEMAFDQMIAGGNEKGSQIVKAAIQALVAQTASIEKAAAVLGVENLAPDTADHQF